MPKNISFKFDAIKEESDALILTWFYRAARRQGWTAEEADMVYKEAKSGDRAHLVKTISKYCEITRD